MRLKVRVFLLKFFTLFGHAAKCIKDKDFLIYRSNCQYCLHILVKLLILPSWSKEEKSQGLLNRFLPFCFGWKTNEDADLFRSSFDSSILMC